MKGKSFQGCCRWELLSLQTRYTCFYLCRLRNLETNEITAIQATAWQWQTYRKVAENKYVLTIFPTNEIFH